MIAKKSMSWGVLVASSTYSAFSEAKTAYSFIVAPEKSLNPFENVIYIIIYAVIVAAVMLFLLLPLTVVVVVVDVFCWCRPSYIWALLLLFGLFVVVVVVVVWALA